MATLDSIGDSLRTSRNLRTVKKYNSFKKQITNDLILKNGSSNNQDSVKTDTVSSIQQ